MIMQGAKLCSVESYVQNNANFKNLQNANHVRTCRIVKRQCFAGCKIILGAMLCRVQNAKYKTMQSAKLCKVQDKTRYKILPGAKSCKSQLNPCSVTAWAPAQRLIYNLGQFVHLCVRLTIIILIKV